MLLLDFLNMTLIFFHWKSFDFPPAAIPAPRSTSFSHHVHIFRTQHSHLRIKTSTSRDHNCNWLQALYCVNSIETGVVIQRCGWNACLKKNNTRSKQLLSYALNDELCFYDMSYALKDWVMLLRRELCSKKPSFGA